ncbi:hypothetical protein BHE74_00001270 [Ensete ventricosum]|nr:hypothetical protein GW17_00061352 [Ensete ventricosum]RWW89694.1 hypothetical protein BHE74_00001270 [Ensete ventricosum]RZS28964.1 hypothetical protein BHM03_00062639 [Ensete ventricosum]
MVGAESGTWIYTFICFFFLLASLEVDAYVPMTLLHSAVAKGAGRRMVQECGTMSRA